MKEGAYVTYLRYESELRKKDHVSETIQTGWKIRFLKSDVLWIVGFPYKAGRSEIYINLAHNFEFNMPRGIDKDGNENIIEDWINPKAKIGELIQLRENLFFPIEKEETITIELGGYERSCMVINWEKSIHNGGIIGHLYYDKRTGILLKRFQQRYGEGKNKYSVTVRDHIHSTNIPELMGNTTIRICLICGEIIPENFRFCGSCRAPVNDKRCPVCRGVLPEDARFCGNCGAGVTDDATRIY